MPEHINPEREHMNEMQRLDEQIASDKVEAKKLLADTFARSSLFRAQPWSVMVTVSMPNSLDLAKRSLKRIAPSSILYWVWTWRWTKFAGSVIW